MRLRRPLHCSRTICSLCPGRYLTPVSISLKSIPHPLVSSGLLTEIRDEQRDLSKNTNRDIHHLTRQRHLRRLIRICQNLRSKIIEMIASLERGERRYACHDIGAHVKDQCNQHEPIVPTNCLDDYCPAVESRGHEYYRENRQRYLNSENEWSARLGVVVVCWRPFQYVLEGRECGHVAAVVTLSLN